MLECSISLKVLRLMAAAYLVVGSKRLKYMLTFLVAAITITTIYDNYSYKTISFFINVFSTILIAWEMTLA